MSIVNFIWTDELNACKIIYICTFTVFATVKQGPLFFPQKNNVKGVNSHFALQI